MHRHSKFIALTNDQNTCFIVCTTVFLQVTYQNLLYRMLSEFACKNKPAHSFTILGKAVQIAIWPNKIFSGTPPKKTITTMSFGIIVTIMSK